ncbi:MAG: CsgG/HfaB family protein [Desulfobacteria bacterium]
MKSKPYKFLLFAFLLFYYGCVHNVIVDNYIPEPVQSNSIIAITEFEDQVTRRTNSMFSMSFPQKPGAQFSDVLTSSLLRANRFRIIERNQIAKILREQQLQLTGLMNEGNYEKIGKLLGADYIIIGSITDAWWGSDVITHQSSITGSFRIVSVSTGSTLSSGTFSKRKFTSDLNKTIREVTDDIVLKLK